MRKHIPLTLFCSLLALFSKGHADSSPDIANGQDAEPTKFPFEVSIQSQNRKHFCGGSIYNENYILTAGHCVVRYQWFDREDWPIVLAGTINLKEPGDYRKVEKIIAHENYSYTSKDSVNNDIGLLKLDRPLKYNPKIQPIPIAEPHYPLPDGTPVQASGWGNLFGPFDGDKDRPSILQETTIWIADQDFCVKEMEPVERTIRPTNVCAYNNKTDSGTCFGDSGGPLTHNGKLVGIVSWGIPSRVGNGFVCGTTEFPDVFTRVSEYNDWIKQHAI